MMSWVVLQCAVVLVFSIYYVFHTWSFCAGLKTSAIGLFELCLIIICWIFGTYTQILSRDVEDFSVHAQIFLMMILDNKVFQHLIICAYTQILNRDMEVFCVRAQKFLIVILDNKVFAYTQIFSGDEEYFCVHAQKFLIMILDNKFVSATYLPNPLYDFVKPTVPLGDTV